MSFHRVLLPGRFAALGLLGACICLVFLCSGASAETRIVNGTDADMGDWPFIAALMQRSGPDNATGQFCGGSLAAAQWVVTAAHCVTGAAPAETDVLLGRRDLDGSGGTRIQVDGVVIHPDYVNNASHVVADLAMLHLASPAPQAAAQLVPQGDPQGLVADWGRGAIAGWGRTGSRAPGASVLQELEVTIFPHEYAAQNWRSAGTVLAPGGRVLDETMVAIGVSLGGAGACYGDSGGPLVVDGPGGFYLAGATSSTCAPGCAQPLVPTAYTAMASYADWIQATMQRAGTPAVTVAEPVDGATGWYLNSGFSVAFDTAMDAASVNATSVTLTDEHGNPVAGSVDYAIASRRLVFDPAADLAPLTLYNATLSGLRSSLGPALPDTSFVFTTGTTDDLVRPQVIGQFPAAGSEVPDSVTLAAVYFSEVLDAATIDSSTVFISGVDAEPHLSRDAKAVFFDLEGKLESGATYAVTVKASVADLSGVTMATDTSWTFTIGSDDRGESLTVMYTVPGDAITQRTVDTAVGAAFSVPMNPQTVTSDTFHLSDGLSRVPAVVSYYPDSPTALLVPRDPLSPGTAYRATLDPGIEDAYGRRIAGHSWVFYTADPANPNANGTANATVQSATGAGSITVTSKTAGAGLFGVRALSDRAPALSQVNRPGNRVFPSGVLAFQLKVANPGDTAVVDVGFPEASAGDEVWKVASSGWSRHTGASIVSPGVVRLTLTDGGPNDEDGAANGVIVDPVALADTDNGSGSGGGCVLFPGNRGDAALALVLPAAFALFVLRRVRRG